MRYQDWDVLVFPELSKIPLQEFKTSCQVIQDPEAHSLQVNTHLLPTVTSFIPGLPNGTGFRISIHSWRNPVCSRYIESLKKPGDAVVFEARLFIDGRMAGSKWFNSAGPWPTIIELSIDLDKNGDFEKLKFPMFHRELLSQSHWNPGDDLGRVKVVIAEGFSRDNLTCPFERVKNIVSFSFQHAPLDVLEQSSIAWPNANMWRQVAMVSPYYTQQYSPRHQEDILEAHGHSPRHNPAFFNKQTFPPVPFIHQVPSNVYPRQPNQDPFIEPRGPFSGWRQISSDVSMPDYSSSSSASLHATSRNTSDPMQISERGDRGFESIQMAGAFDSLCEALIPSAPTNTPQNAAALAAPPATRISSLKSEAAPVAKASPDAPSKTPTVPLKPIPNEIIKSRKENVTELQAQPDLGALANEHMRIVSHTSNHSTGTSKSRKENITEVPVQADVGTVVNENLMRIVSQASNTSSVGFKRQRVVTPASAKVIDDEDEPRSSPALRKVSRASTNKDAERRVLGEIENN